MSYNNYWAEARYWYVYQLADYVNQICAKLRETDRKFGDHKADTLSMLMANVFVFEANLRQCRQ